MVMDGSMYVDLPYASLIRKELPNQVKVVSYIRTNPRYYDLNLENTEGIDCDGWLWFL